MASPNPFDSCTYSTPKRHDTSFQISAEWPYGWTRVSKANRDVHSQSSLSSQTFTHCDVPQPIVMCLLASCSASTASCSQVQRSSFTPPLLSPDTRSPAQSVPGCFAFLGCASVVAPVMKHTVSISVFRKSLEKCFSQHWPSNHVSRGRSTELTAYLVLAQSS